MRTWNPYNSSQLAKQIAHQKSHAWKVETALPWQKGIALEKLFLPLDPDCLVFPGANPSQKETLSQLAGLIINATISEMEAVIHKLKDSAWNSLLNSYPINPEMRELGELFFEEEERHSEIFSKYNQVFCAQTGIKPSDLKRLLPQAYGSYFQRAVIKNSKRGGHAFWWVVASVEEVSLEIFRHMRPYKQDIDPLYFELHKLHFDDEARHRNYAFFMLDMIYERPAGPTRWLYRKTDLVKAQILTTSWILAELHKVFRATELANKHPFFESIASCLPLFKKMSMRTLVTRLFAQTPYISHVLNTRYHRYTVKMAEQHRAWSLPLPEPNTLQIEIPERQEC